MIRSDDVVRRRTRLALVRLVSEGWSSVARNGHRDVIASVGEAIQGTARDSGLRHCARNDGGETERAFRTTFCQAIVRAEFGGGEASRMGAHLRVQELHALISRNRRGTRKP